MTNEEYDALIKKSERQVGLAVGLIIIAVLLSALALIGAMTKTDNDAEQELYCKLVHERVQPDYNGSYQRNCLEGKMK